MNYRIIEQKSQVKTVKCWETEKTRYYVSTERTFWFWKWWEPLTHVVCIRGRDRDTIKTFVTWSRANDYVLELRAKETDKTIGDTRVVSTIVRENSF